MQPSDKVCIGIAYFTEEEWQKLRTVVKDPSTLDETYAAWKAGIDRLKSSLLEQGLRYELIDIRIDDLLAWCRRKKCEPDSAARSEYASQKLLERRQPWRAN